MNNEKSDASIGATVRMKMEDGSYILGTIVDFRVEDEVRQYLITPFKNTGLQGYVWHPASSFGGVAPFALLNVPKKE